MTKRNLNNFWAIIISKNRGKCKDNLVILQTKFISFIYYLNVSLINLSCSTQIDKQILGIWEVQSKFYKATYKIEKQGSKLIGKVVYYNDDTTILHETGTDKDIFLKNLKYDDGAYVDAVSGATKTTSESLTIKIKHKDTLEVTNYIRHKPLIEVWTRRKKQ